MQITQNEILFIYNSKDLQDRQALGYAKSLPDHKIKEFDLQKNKFTELQLQQIANMLEMDPVSLIDNKSDTYQKTYSQVELTRSGALKALASKPELMKTPIALYNDQAKHIKSPYQIVKWEMASPPVIKDFAKMESTPDIQHDSEKKVFYADLDNQDDLDSQRMTLEYTRPEPDIIDFTSTFVPKSHRKRGYGKMLVNAGLDYAKKAELTVKASCPFVEDILKESSN
jgi:predicted GNAT family acetyltransferase/arsenate reductase-like glutaredoxin family protein